MKEKSRKIMYYLLAFLIPIIVMLMVYMKIGIYPFGDKTLLAADMDHQYVSFFAYLQDNIGDPNNLLYSLTKTMGGNLVGITGYYLASPLNLLLLLFSKENLTEGILALTLVKIGLCGLTCSIFLNQNKKQNSYNLLFTTAYALMTYNIIYQCNVMWLDAIILLPMVALGIDKLVTENKTILYTLALAFSIITNYYMGFMICMVAFIYFVYRIFREEKQIEMKKVIVRFILHSILGAGISAVVLVPCVLSLQGGKAGFELSSLEIARNFTLPNFLTKLFTGKFIYADIDRSLPHIFCGVYITYFVALLFVNKKISKKEKILSALLLIFFYFNYQIKAINLIWHGFNKPNSYTFRNAFVICFFLILLAHRSYEQIKEGLTMKRFLVVTGFCLGIGAFVAVKGNVGLTRAFFDLLLLMISASLVAIVIKRKVKIGNSILVAILLATLLIDLGANAYLILRQYFYYTKESYTPYVVKLDPIIEEIKQKDTSIYRIEKDFRRTHNDSYLFGYYGLSNFTSGESVATTNFLKQMGYKTTKVWAYFGDGDTQLANSMLGIKYILSKKEMPSSYQKIDTKEDMIIYQNPYVLPMIMPVNETIEKATISGSNLFEIQNAIAKQMAGEKLGDVLKREEIKKITLYNLETEEEEGETKYQKQEKEKQAYIEYELVPTTRRCSLYVLVDR